ncbi:MAG TPA: ATP-dependent DNA helicase [Trebonia sp.]|nr:ATP-dependent DNA helicase [Trebonia sp.]
MADSMPGSALETSALETSAPEDSVSYEDSASYKDSVSYEESAPDASAPGSHAVRDTAPDAITDELLEAAIAGIGGAERPGQTVMAHRVWDAMSSGTHLAVQAGTGTGKSVAYLVPAFRLAAEHAGPVVVSTATIALQRQLVERDLPRLAQALGEPLGHVPSFAIFKGRANYVCKHKLKTAPDDTQDAALISRASASGNTALGAHIKRLHEWAEQTKTGDRDELVPGVPDLAWRQASVAARECIGPGKCGFGAKCFSEKARKLAADADIVVTNHALLAIDALGEGILPEHRVVIVDEAHELVDRVTSVASGELSPAGIEIAVRRTGKLAEDAEVTRLTDAGAALGPLLAPMPAGRMDALDDVLAGALESLRDAAQACALDVRKKAEAEGGLDGTQQAAAQLALVGLDDIAATADRIVQSFEQEVAEREEVTWIERSDDGPVTSTLRIAPLEVAEELAQHLFCERTVILTSATLTLGGSFDPLATRWGLDVGSKGHEWDGIDVGSPFAHGKSGILYVARQLPPPGRDRLADEYLQELWELIKAAGGRTLGLFSSMRAARQATAALRDSLPFPLLCQGDDATGQLVKQFSQDEPTCLFGTLSLWQGVDVPGPSLRLVVIDRIPFPRPDDPLASARTRAAEARGGNGFMEVSAAHAALLLAQGAGRLLRSMDDRGVVAVLDPRLITKRYGDFLRASLPPFWQTTDPEVVRGALRRLDHS